LQAKSRLLGDECPDAINAVRNLAIKLREQGQLEDAATIQKEMLEKQERVVDKNHPYIIITISKLSVTLRDQGYLEENSRDGKGSAREMEADLGQSLY
jgi:hypothetical protein